MTTSERPELERQRYWQGQRLASRDFNDQLAAEAELRWWHNRALHDAYGVVVGCAPEREEDGSLKISGGVLRISPGLAYDCFGRELILAGNRAIPLPSIDASQPGGWTLLLSGVAPPSGGARGAVWQEQPDLRWLPTRRVELRDGIPLLSLDERNEEIVGLRPPLARPEARSRTAHGETIRGKTAWREWIVEPLEISGIEVVIDTSAAGFSEVPCYFVSLRGGPLSPSPGDASPLLEVGRITRATCDSFTFRLWLWNESLIPEPFFLAGTHLASQARRLLFVCWLGIEMHRPAEGQNRSI